MIARSHGRTCHAEEAARGQAAGVKAMTDGFESDGKAQMKHAASRLPKLMRFIPGTAQDVRTYFLALQYWLAGSDENMANLVRMLVGRYSGRSTAKVAAPVNYPDVGLYHPGLPGRITEKLELLPRSVAAGLSGERRPFRIVDARVKPGNDDVSTGTVGCCCCGRI